MVCGCDFCHIDVLSLRLCWECVKFPFRSCSGAGQVRMMRNLDPTPTFQ